MFAGLESLYGEEAFDRSFLFCSLEYSSSVKSRADAGLHRNVQPLAGKGNQWINGSLSGFSFVPREVREYRTSHSLLLLFFHRGRFKSDNERGGGGRERVRYTTLNGRSHPVHYFKINGNDKHDVIGFYSFLYKLTKWFFKSELLKMNVWDIIAVVFVLKYIMYRALYSYSLRRG